MTIIDLLPFLPSPDDTEEEASLCCSKCGDHDSWILGCDAQMQISFLRCMSDECEGRLRLDVVDGAII